MNIETIAILKDSLAKANTLYNKNVEGLISLDQESLTNLNNILEALNAELVAIQQGLD